MSNHLPNTEASADHRASSPRLDRFPILGFMLFMFGAGIIIYGQVRVAEGNMDEFQGFFLAAGTLAIGVLPFMIGLILLARRLPDLVHAIGRRAAQQNSRTSESAQPSVPVHAIDHRALPTLVRTALLAVLTTAAGIAGAGVITTGLAIALYGFGKAAGIVIAVFFGIPLLVLGLFLFGPSAAGRNAGRQLAAFIAGTAVIGAVSSVGIRHLSLQHVRPLLAHVDAHWVRVPNVWSLSAKRIRRAGGHLDSLRIRQGDMSWFVEARHEISGWCFDGVESEATASARPIRPYRGMYDDPIVPGRDSEPQAAVMSSEEARSYLLAIGVPDRHTRTAGVVRGIGGEQRYVVRSGLAEGSYHVSPDGNAWLYLSRPLTVPDSRR